MAKWQYCEVWWDQADDIYITIAGTNHIAQKIAHGTDEWPRILAMLGEDEWELISTFVQPDPLTYWYYFKRPLYNFYDGKTEKELSIKNPLT
jgi:hypothetical protein